MFFSSDEIIHYIKSNNILFVDLLYTSMCGSLKQHTISTHTIDSDVFNNGIYAKNDKIKLIPEANKGFLNPFTTQRTLCFICNNSLDDITNWKNISKKTHGISKDHVDNDFKTKIRFFILDNIFFKNSDNNSLFKANSDEHPSNNKNNNEFGNSGYRKHECLMSSKPYDMSYDIRSEIIEAMCKAGINALSHSHGPIHGSNEISFKSDGIQNTLDNIQISKYIIRNIANTYGKSATFMPRISNSEFKNNTSITHSISKNIAHQYIKGILKNSKALSGIASPAYTNSTLLSTENYWIKLKKKNDEHYYIEYTFIEGCVNHYMALNSTIAAGMHNKCCSGIDKCTCFTNGGTCNSTVNITEQEIQFFTPQDLPTSLNDSLKVLEKKNDFMLNVFDKLFLEKFITYKQIEAKKIANTIQPIEFEFYYNI